MALPLLPLLFAGIALAVGAKSPKAPAAVPPGAAGAGGGSDLLGLETDARGVLRYRADVAPLIAAQLQNATAAGQGNVRTLIQPHNPAMGQDAATWAMVSAEMGKVVLLSVVRSPSDPRQICAVAPGQEVSLAAGPAAKWAVLFDPMSGGQIPQVPGLPGEPSPEEVTPIVLESGLQYVRPDATAQIVSELASKTLVPGADAGERVQAPPYMTGENGAAWVMQQAAAGQFVIMLRRPYPAGQHARLRSVLPAQIGSWAKVGSLYAILAEPVVGVPAQGSPIPGFPQGFPQVPGFPQGFPQVPGMPGAPNVPASYDPGPAFPPGPPQGGGVPGVPGMPPVPPGLPQNMPPVPPFGGGGGGGTPPPYIPPDPAFAGVPEPILRAGIAAESSGDPTRLDALADSIGGQYPAYANALRQKAAGMRSAAKAVAAAQGRLLKIRPGDLASTWAAWYTGNGLRWPELLPLNGLSKKTANGMTFPDPWNVGQTVEIPQAWNWAKGPPPAPSNVARAKKPAGPPPPAQEPNAPSGARTASLPSIAGPLPVSVPNAIDAARRAARK